MQMSLSENIAPAWPILGILAIALVSLLRKHSWFASSSRGRPLPPGPPRLPLIGNLLDIPKGEEPWKAYRDLGKKYGNIISMKVLGRCIIMLNDPDIASELFEKRSAIYSSRPESVVAEKSGWAAGWNFSIMPYGPQWRTGRRTMWQHFHPGVVSKYHALQEEGARRLLLRLLDSSPEKLVEDIRHSLAAVIIKLTYGLDTSTDGDKYLHAFEDAIPGLELLVSGASALEFFPWLTYLPTWFPGTTLPRRLAYYRKAIARMVDLPWEDAKTAVASGRASASIAAALLEEIAEAAEVDTANHEEIAKGVSALTYAAGLDSTDATMRAFFFAMSHHPEVQRKAHEELDAVVGPERLPSISDRDRLPYVNAIVKETLRWHSVLPLNFPHVSTAEDEINGYFIPKDALVMINTWSVMHDPERFPEPNNFMPERFLKEDGHPNLHVLDPASIVFGHGRRICPGRHFADSSLFIYFASVLHTLDISPPLDIDGQPIHIELKIVSDVVSHIDDCRCTVKPRSSSAESLIHSAHF